MFLIKCEDDSSYCIVDNYDVICDENVIENGETVTFFWNKKQFSGEIIMRSENVELLNKEIRRLKKTEVCKKKSLTSHNRDLIASGKRKIVVNRAWSPDQPSTSTKTMKFGNITKKKEILTKSEKSKDIKYDSSNTESSDEDDEDNEDNKKNEVYASYCNYKDDLKNNIGQCEITISPIKEELNRKYYKIKKQSTTNFDTSFIDAKKNCQLSENEEVLKDENTKEIEHSKIDLYLSDDNIIADIDNDNQLLGCNYSGDKMIHLRNGIFCRKKIYDYAMGSSHRASHIARKLLDGVFKQEALINCTFTGQAPRSLGKERQAEEVYCLHNLAKNAIIDFSIRVAETKGWEKQAKEKVKQAMSQKLGEFKRDKRNANKEKVK